MLESGSWGLSVLQTPALVPIVSGGSCLLFSLWVFRVGDLNHT